MDNDTRHDDIGQRTATDRGGAGAVPRTDANGGGDAGHRGSIPRRSHADRKIAGVAGGLGRAFGVDPVLIRVILVVLAVFGGSGVLLYCLGWLLMPDDDDEVSAVEALAGRGHSSVSPALAVVLIIIGLASAGTVFSWGLPFWPVVLAAVVIFLLVGFGSNASRRQTGSAPPPPTTATRWETAVDDAAQRAADWGLRASDWAQQWASPRPGASTDAPTGGSATASTTAGGTTVEDPSTSRSPVDDTDDRSGEQSDGTAEYPTVSATPPPDFPPPVFPPPTQPEPDRPSQESCGHSAPARLVLGVTLILAGVLGGGIAAHWWELSWASAAAITLATLAVGMIAIALGGGRGRSLIAPGIVLTVITLALGVSGIRGTGGIGQQHWTPSSTAAVNGQAYDWSIGQATLDLSDITVDPGETVTVSLTVGVGQAKVIVPSDIRVEATCAARLGQVDCLGATASGVSIAEESTRVAATDAGTIVISIRSNVGQAVVDHG